MPKPIVSVVMPTYNHEKFACSAVRSVLAQTLEEFEFLIADDASTDRTAEVVGEYLEKTGDKRVRFTRYSQNRGASAVLNDLLDECEGEFVAFLNSDDLFEPHKLERQLIHLAGNKNIAASFTWVKLIDEAGQPFADSRCALTGLFDQDNRTREQWLSRLFYGGNCLCHPTLMARRKDFRLRFDPRLSRLIDLDAWVRLLMDENIEVLPDRLTRYRVRAAEANMCGNRADTVALIEHELPVVLDHFARLCESDCAAVFGRTGSEAIRSFAARVAALEGTPPARAWGMRGLYELLGGKKSREELAAIGFGERLLSEIGSQQDVYSLLSHRAQLYFADAQQVAAAGAFLTDAFADDRSATLPAGNFYVFTHTFPLDRPVLALRFDPAEQPCRVRILSAYLHLAGGKTIDTRAFLTHNGKEDNGFILFESYDPSFFFRFGEELNAQSFEIAGEWSFLSPADVLARFAMS